MRINCNISALTANNQLSRGQTELQKSIERLSSGLKINHAEDDAAGMAISKKMKTQLKGIERAKDNSSDGIYVVQTAEGALNEVHAMLQRCRELAVQGASDTYSDEDRVAIQKEIDQICLEVDRVSTDTEYNTMPLLDGTLSRRAYADTDDVNVLTMSGNVSTGEYQFTMTSAPRQASQNMANFTGTITSNEAGTMFINGATVPIVPGDDFDSIYDKMVVACDRAGVEIEKYGAGISFTNNNYGSSEELSIKFSSQELADFFGMSKETVTYGEDCAVSLGAGFPENATVETKGRTVTVKSTNDFNMKFEVPEYSKPGITTIKVTDMGVLNIQAGANEGQTVDIDIPRVNTHVMGIEKLNCGSSSNCGKAIAKIDEAISYVSSVRSKLGAYQNRLENTVESLATYDENMTAALSGLEDCDMAEEMTNYTSKNVIAQAATSVLSQANERPETVLQLLS